MSALTADEVTFRYGDRVILDGVSFSVSGGQVVSLLGPNGSGKTTLLKILLGLLRPMRGSVTINNCPMNDLPARDRARKLAYVPQAHALSFPYRVFDIVLLGRLPYLSFFGSYSREDRWASQDALDRMGISHLASRSYAAVSGGERQLVLIARAIAQGAEVLIMDEPVSGLDYGNQLRLLLEVQALARDGYTVVKSTHFPDHAFLSSDAVVLLHKGKILAQGLPGDVITPGHLQQLYDVDVSIVTREDGLLCCLPVRSTRNRSTPPYD